MPPLHIVDIHPHIISADDARYPRAPLFGKQSEWSRDRPVTLEQYLAAMEAAGVHQAAVVQASTCYGYDNSYVTDSVMQHPGTLTAVCTVDLLAADAPDRIRHWQTRGLGGLRLFTGGSTKEFDPSTLDDPRSFPAWELCADLGIPICLQTNATGLDRVVGLAKRFPGARIILDHLGRPDLSDGPPYANAASLFALAAFENIHLKLTSRTVAKARGDSATPETFFPRLVAEFGSRRIAWGSNFPANSGTLTQLVDGAKDALACLTDEDQAWIFGRTAQRLYRSLASA